MIFLNQNKNLMALLTILYKERISGFKWPI